jgi:hypothetical protein
MQEYRSNAMLKLHRVWEVPELYAGGRREVDGLRKVGNAKFKFNFDVDPCQVGRKAGLDKSNYTVSFYLGH